MQCWREGPMSTLPTRSVICIPIINWLPCSPYHLTSQEGHQPIDVARKINDSAMKNLLTRWSSFYKVLPPVQNNSHLFPSSYNRNNSFHCQIYDMATIGDHQGLLAAFDVLSSATPEELSFLHPQSVIFLSFFRSLVSSKWKYNHYYFLSCIS